MISGLDSFFLMFLGFEAKSNGNRAAVWLRLHSAFGRAEALRVVLRREAKASLYLRHVLSGF